MACVVLMLTDAGIWAIFFMRGEVRALLSV